MLAVEFGDALVAVQGGGRCVNVNFALLGVAWILFDETQTTGLVDVVDGAEVKETVLPVFLGFGGGALMLCMPAPPTSSAQGFRKPSVACVLYRKVYHAVAPERRPWTGMVGTASGRRRKDE